MTTAESMVCDLLGCGIDDIEPMFGSMVKNGYFRNAVDRASEYGENSATSIFEEGIRLAIENIFGVDMLEKFEIDTNYQAAQVTLLCEPKDIEDFDNKLERFENYTGYTINY